MIGYMSLPRECDDGDEHLRGYRMEAMSPLFLHAQMPARARVARICKRWCATSMNTATLNH
jgi:hypothetical protein